MKTVLPLRYLIVPAIVAWAMVFITVAFSLKIKIGDWATVLAWASGIATVASVFSVFLIVPFLASIARGEFNGFNFKKYEEVEKIPFTVRAETETGSQVDFFQGLKPEQWRDCALRLSAHIRAGNRSFTYNIVGQTERPILVPLMFAAGYIAPVGNGEWELTEKGAMWWLSLAAIPWPYDHVPEKIRRLWK